MSFLKAYQKNWVNRLENSDSEEEVALVCEEIMADDTGHTDELSQQLAKEILLLVSLAE